MKFPVFSLFIREFGPETRSLLTASSATQSVDFTYILEKRQIPRGVERDLDGRFVSGHLHCLLNRAHHLNYLALLTASPSCAEIV